jgi:hypothetical protein
VLVSSSISANGNEGAFRLGGQLSAYLFLNIPANQPSKAAFQWCGTNSPSFFSSSIFI